MQEAQAAEAKADAAVEIVPLPASTEDGESTTIYVKNLAFATTDAGLQVSADHTWHVQAVITSQQCLEACAGMHLG